MPPSTEQKIATAIGAIFEPDTSRRLKGYASKLVAYAHIGYGRMGLEQRIAHIQVEKLKQNLDPAACGKLADCILEVAGNPR